MKRTLIINYSQLGPGGIESAIADLMMYYLGKGDRVIWITDQKNIENALYQEIAKNNKIEKVLVGHKNLFFLPKIKLKQDEKIVMISFRALHFIYYERIRRKYKLYDFRHYYAIAHFEGREYYPEDYFSGVLIKRFVYNYWKRIVKKLVANNVLLGFHKKHLEQYEEKYQIEINDIQDKLIPTLFVVSTFDEKNTRLRYKEIKDKFIISTCARMDFPHKGYVLGLVDTFERLKKKYNFLKLRIIGDGKDRGILLDRIEKLNEDVRKDIEVFGNVSKSVLYEYYKTSHLVVGVSGGAIYGAICGIPTLTLRHYSYECETYGFIDESIENVLGEEKAAPIDEYIEKILKMSEDDYVKHAKAGFNIIKTQNAGVDPESIFNYIVPAEKKQVNVMELLLGKILYMYSQFV